METQDKISSIADSNISFPQKLYTLMEFEDGNCVHWAPHGFAFIIKDQERFMNEVVPKYFKHTKLTSFQRQLNLYGFRRLSKGDDQGAYFHPKFQRYRRDLVQEIKRLPVKGSLQTLEEVMKANKLLPSERFGGVKRKPGDGPFVQSTSAGSLSSGNGSRKSVKSNGSGNSNGYGDSSPNRMGYPYQYPMPPMPYGAPYGTGNYPMPPYPYSYPPHMHPGGSNSYLPMNPYYAVPPVNGGDSSGASSNSHSRNDSGTNISENGKSSTKSKVTMNLGFDQQFPGYPYYYPGYPGVPPQIPQSHGSKESNHDNSTSSSSNNIDGTKDANSSNENLYSSNDVLRPRSEGNSEGDDGDDQSNKQPMMPMMGPWGMMMPSNGYYPPPFYGVPPGQHSQYGHNQYVYDQSSGGSLPQGAPYGAVPQGTFGPGNVPRINTAEELDRLVMLDSFLSSGNLSQSDFDILRSSHGNLRNLAAAGSSNSLAGGGFNREGSRDALASMYGSIRKTASINNTNTQASSSTELEKDKDQTEADPLAALYSGPGQGLSELKHPISAPAPMYSTVTNDSSGLSQASKSMMDMALAARMHQQFQQQKMNHSSDDVRQIDGHGTEPVTGKQPELVQIPSISNFLQASGCLHDSVSMLSLLSDKNLADCSKKTDNEAVGNTASAIEQL